MISINQPYFFPNIGYFQLLARSDTHVFMNNVSMRKKSWITRNIFEPDKLYSIKIKKLSQNRAISDHYFSDFDLFKINFLDYLAGCLKNNMYSKEVIETLEHIFELCSVDPSIADFNIHATKLLSERLDLKTNFLVLSDLNIAESKSVDRLISVCKHVGDQNYLNLETGTTLYDPNIFLSHGVTIAFNDTRRLKDVLNQNFYISLLSVVSKFGFDYVANVLFENK